MKLSFVSGGYIREDQQCAIEEEQDAEQEQRDRNRKQADADFC